MWRSLVARFVRVEEVAGSSPATPTATKIPRGTFKSTRYFYLQRTVSFKGNSRLIHQRQNGLQVFDPKDVLLTAEVAIDDRLSLGFKNRL